MNKKLTLIFLLFKEELRVSKEVLAVGDSDFCGASAQGLKVELAVFAHPGNILVVLEKCNKFFSLRFGFLLQLAGFLTISRDQPGCDLLL